jgi:peptidoglycan hydrolase-like protein with peptidoglycan-binding domain
MNQGWAFPAGLKSMMKYRGVGQTPTGKEKRNSRFRVGHLDPIDEVSGYQQRLSNLGYNPGEIDGIEGSKTKSAIRSFQNFENYLAGSEVLKVDGIMGPKTKEKLGQRHGY